MEAIVYKNNIKLLVCWQSKSKSGEPMDWWIDGSIGWMNWWMDRSMNLIMDQSIEWSMERLIEWSMDGSMDGSMDVWIDQIIYESIAWPIDCLSS